MKKLIPFSFALISSLATASSYEGYYWEMMNDGTAYASTVYPEELKNRFHVPISSYIDTTIDGKQLVSFALIDFSEYNLFTKSCNYTKTKIDTVSWKINGKNVLMDKYCRSDERYFIYYATTQKGKDFIVGQLKNNKQIELRHRKGVSHISGVNFEHTWDNFGGDAI